MLNKLLLAFTAAGALAAFAASNTYRVDILENTMVEGKQVKPGSYKIEVENNVATLKHGKESIQVPARVETGSTKFDNTKLQYSDNALHQISVGGTNTKIVFEGSGPAGSGGSN